jgi:hypothetical protein
MKGHLSARSDLSVTLPLERARIPFPPPVNGDEFRILDAIPRLHKRLKLRVRVTCGDMLMKQWTRNKT